MQQLFKAHGLVSRHLKNGMKAVCAFQEGETAAIGVFINAGSRQENFSNNGVSHFLEHMYFKGTSERSITELEDLFENCGSLLCAHTSREYTCYTSHGLSEYLDISLEAISDMLLRPVLSPTEIHKERSTILREYDEVNKIIEEYFYDYLHEMAYPSHPLGYTILGPIENIETLEKSAMEEFRRCFYNSNNMVLAAAGNISIDELVRLGNEFLLDLPAHEDHATWTESECHFCPGVRDVVELEDSKNSLMTGLAFEGPGMSTPDLYLLNLFQVMAGFYDVHETNNYMTELTETLLEMDDSISSVIPFCLAYTDRSLFGTNFVNDGNSVSNELVDVALDLFRNVSMTEEILDSAKAFLVNQAILLRQENLQFVLEDIGRTALFVDEHYWDVENAVDHIQSVTVEDMDDFVETHVRSVEPVILQMGDTRNL